MAHEIRQFTATIPAGTLASAPFRQSMTMPPRYVDRLEIIVPPGGAGLIGFALTNSGVTVIPYDSDLWVITSDEKIVWDLEGANDSGSWGLAGYNTGSVDHAVYVRFLCRVPQLVTSASAPYAGLPSVSYDPSVDVAPADIGNGL
jgi:hypothetical protein